MKWPIILAVCAALFLAVFLLAGCAAKPDDPAPTAGRGEKLVGTDVKLESVTEFYYTYSTSTDPPHYQRYRFYTEDGKRFFFPTAVHDQNHSADGRILTVFFGVFFYGVITRFAEKHRLKELFFGQIAFCKRLFGKFAD